jgi:hypothetical protein
MEHLSDEQLQMFLRGEGGDDNASFESHLEQCPKCREQLLAYKYIDEAIGDAPLGDFSDNFETAVMDQVSEFAENKPKPIYDYFVVALAFVGFAVIATVFYFFTPIREIILQSFGELWQTTGTVFGEKTINGWLEITLYSMIILICFGIFDRFAMSRRWRNFLL